MLFVNKYGGILEKMLGWRYERESAAVYDRKEKDVGHYQEQMWDQYWSWSTMKTEIQTHAALTKLLVSWDLFSVTVAV